MALSIKQLLDDDPKGGKAGRLGVSQSTTQPPAGWSPPRIPGMVRLDAGPGSHYEWDRAYWDWYYKHNPQPETDSPFFRTPEDFGGSSRAVEMPEPPGWAARREAEETRIKEKSRYFETQSDATGDPSESEKDPDPFRLLRRLFGRSEARAATPAPERPPRKTPIWWDPAAPQDSRAREATANWSETLNTPFVQDTLASILAELKPGVAEQRFTTTSDLLVTGEYYPENSDLGVPLSIGLSDYWNLNDTRRRTTVGHEVGHAVFPNAYSGEMWADMFMGAVDALSQTATDENTDLREVALMALVNTNRNRKLRGETGDPRYDRQLPVENYLTLAPGWLGAPTGDAWYTYQAEGLVKKLLNSDIYRSHPARNSK